MLTELTKYKIDFAILDGDFINKRREINQIQISKTFK
jgi:hypothetical protein